MATVQGFIDSVLRLIQVLDAGESASATESNHALEAANQMLSSWSAQGLPVYQLSTETIPLTGASSYTLAPRRCPHPVAIGTGPRAGGAVPTEKTGNYAGGSRRSPALR